MNKIKLISSIFLTAISFTSSADIYSGFKIGKSWLDDACLSYDICNTDDSKYSTLGGMIGFNTSHTFSLEASYDYLGQFTATGLAKEHVTAITFAPKITIPIYENINIFTKIGGAFVDYGQNDDLSYLLGVGLEFDITRHISLRIEYQHLSDINNDLVRSKANSSTLGIVYKFLSEPEDPILATVTETQELVTYSKPDEPVVNIFDTIKFEITGFKFDSSTISTKQNQQITEIANILKSYPMATVIITGHTDSIGSTKYNRKLSQQRAKAVFDNLVHKGIEHDRILYQGAAASEPIDTNTTSIGRSNNRRVEIIIPEFKY
ncbi:OmpA family protein [Vibrio cincinnatiensis]|uniref:OmpA family protein n=1 Tax=Vibrio cincinnatiensis TaxID=675 RepID=UPI0012ACA542|nr:OmpA family protein [Vibrio cincinnatiensis]